MALASGAKLGPYQIQSAIGEGGMGEVYLARDTRLGRDVAIKVLPQHFSSHPVWKERFEREARAISSLNHPRICTLHDVGHQDGVDFLVMEYLSGETLAERLKKGPLPLKEVLKIGMEAGEALEVAHRAGIIHRDLKPGNIMLTQSGVKLMDFGLAKATAADGEPATAAPQVLTAAPTISVSGPAPPLTGVGAVMGTLQYMSPEQIEGKKADARSDLFALGAVLYEMATGKRPFEGKRSASVASAILEKDPEPISALQPLTPPAFEHVVTTCLAKNPDDRFQAAHNVRLELKWIAEGASQLVAPALSPASKTAASIVPWALAAIIALGAGGAFFLTRHAQPQVQYTTVTFREGILQAARFSHDGQTIIYSGKWEGEPPQVAMARVGSPESRPLGIASGAIAAVSSSDELAVLQGCETVFLMDCGGTLATVSLAGGAPRALAGHVAYADWSPDGKLLVVSIYSPDGARLEFPPGHLLCEQKTGWFGHPRFSPDGSLIAFENHPTFGDDLGAVEVVDLRGKRRVLSQQRASLEGLAWRPDGKEVWYAGATDAGGWAGVIYAVTLSGKVRTVLTLPSVRLHDISSDGRVLLSHDTWSSQLMGLFPGDRAEHPYSWLDDTIPAAISSDGRLISFSEEGEGQIYTQGDNLAYYRRTDGSPAVRLGLGDAVISPDGKWAIAYNQKDRNLLLQPIELGETKELPTPGLAAFTHAAWSDDGRQIAYEAQTLQTDWNVYTQPVSGGPPILVKTKGRNSFPVLSPNGDTVALREERGGISLYRAAGGPPLAVKGVLDSEYPVRFTRGGRSLLVVEPTGGELVLTLVDLASGHRELWKRFKAEAEVGTTVVVTPDLRYYAYPSPRLSSELYLVDNLR